MKKIFPGGFLLLSLLSFRYAAAQVYLGASLDPGSFMGGKDDFEIGISSSSFEAVLASQFPREELGVVFESTSPEKAIAELSRKGFYRTETVYLITLAVQKKIKFKEIFKEREKGETLAGISAKNHFDFYENYPRAAALKEEVERNSRDDIRLLYDELVNRRMYRDGDYPENEDEY